MKDFYYVIIFGFFIFLLGCEKPSGDIYLDKILDQANRHFTDGNYHESFRSYNEIIDFTNVNDSDSLIRARLISLLGIGRIYENLGNFNNALDKYNEALLLAEDKGNLNYQIFALNNMTHLEKNPDDILKILHEAEKKIDMENERVEEIPLTHISLIKASAYIKKRKEQKAITILDSIIAVCSQKKELQYEVSKSYKFKGKAYAQLNLYDKAINEFNKALQIIESKYDFEIDRIDIILLKAETLIALNDLKSAKAYLTEVEKFSINDVIRQRKAKELFASIYEQTDELKNSIKTLHDLRKIDSKMSDQKNRINGYVYHKIENESLKKDIRIQKSQNTFLFIGLILTSLLYFLYIYFNKLKLQNEKDLISINAYMNGQEEERKQYAAQLHDSLGANLAAVNMHLSLLKKDLPDKKYERISGMLKNVIIETRNISHNILPPLLVNQGIVAAITEKALEWSCDTLQFEVESTIERVMLNDNLEIALYRAVLECMKNTMDNANATKTKVIFEQSENYKLHVTIKDNGKGFDVGIIDRGEGGLGINGVKNRIKYFKGNFDIESKIGNGTTVRISVPVLKMKQTA